MPLFVYAGLAGDRNPRGMAGAVALGTAIGATLGLVPEIVGAPAPLVSGDWKTQLAAATPALHALAEAISEPVATDTPLILTMGRCAASLATLPLVARRHPDAVLVWFDAHGDINVPHGRAPGAQPYLGGMVITGAAGEWDTGLGAGFTLANLILVGARDLDPPEQARIDRGEVTRVPVGPDLVDRLTAAIAGRPVHVHLDCDVLDPGLVATEYSCADGLSFADLHAACVALARHAVIGLEITEFEATWPDGRPAGTAPLIAALRPLLDRLAARA